MYNICCTAKLLKRLGIRVDSFVPDSTTALGSWYANILFFHHAQILLFVSDQSRLAVITPAREVRSLANHLRHHLTELLEALGAQHEWIDAEVREMENVVISTTHSRSVLATMNDYKYSIEQMIQQSDRIEPFEISLSLSKWLIGPINYEYPGDLSLRLLKERYDQG